MSSTSPEIVGARFLPPRLFGIDLRTLALFRIFLAITCIVYLIGLWPDIATFFDDKGLHPRRISMMRNPYAWSLYYVSGKAAWAHLLFFLTFLSSLALLFGYRTRIAVIITWFLIVSLCARMDILRNGGPIQLTLLLFWAMFLPLGARFSIDAALSQGSKNGNMYASWATFALLIQEMYLYFFGALHKTGDTWRVTHDAVYYALNVTHLTSPLASHLVPWVHLESSLTILIYYLELLAVVLLFSPYKTAWARLFILPFLILLHVGFALFLSIGPFPLVSITGILIFLPGLFWNKLLPWWNGRASRKNITIFYDGECNFCRKTCVIFRELGLPPETRILPAQQQPKIYALMQQYNSWVVEDGGGNCRTRWDAVAWVWRRSPILWPLGAFFLLPFMNELGDKIYSIIARNRSGLGRMSARFFPEYEGALAFSLGKFTQGFVLFLTVTVMIWNIGNLPGYGLGQYRRPMAEFLHIFGLWQDWRYFAPDAPALSKWVVIEGRDTNGSVFDLLHNKTSAPTHGQPPHGYASFKNYAWREFFSRVPYEKSHMLLGSTYCAFWETSHPDLPIEEVVFTVYTRKVAPPLSDPLPVKKAVAFSYGCKKKTPSDKM